MSRGEVRDGVATNEASKMAQIWQIRELIPTAQLKEKSFFKYDISVPLARFYDIVPAIKERVGDLASVCGFGHVGDSNLHVHIMCDNYNEEIYKRIEPFIYEYTAGLGGSISAEHGIGFQKRDYLKSFKQKEALDLMRALKNVMDPKGILNPYKVLTD